VGIRGRENPHEVRKPHGGERTPTRSENLIVTTFAGKDFHHGNFPALPPYLQYRPKGLKIARFRLLACLSRFLLHIALGHSNWLPTVCRAELLV